MAVVCPGALYCLEIFKSMTGAERRQTWPPESPSHGNVCAVTHSLCVQVPGRALTQYESFYPPNVPVIMDDWRGSETAPPYPSYIGGVAFWV